MLLGNAIRPLTRELSHDAFTKEDLTNIRELSKEPDVLRQLARSLAPSICGHDYEKVPRLAPSAPPPQLNIFPENRTRNLPVTNHRIHVKWSAARSPLP